MAKAARTKPAGETAVADDGWQDIEVVDEGTQLVTEQPVTAKPEEADDPQAEIDARIAELAEANKAREEAERRATEAEKAKTAAEKSREEEINNRVRADEAALANAVTAAETEIAKLKTEAKTAFEAGDSTAFTEANEKIASLRYDVRANTDQLSRIAAWKENEIAKAKAAETQRAQPQQQQFSPATKAWLDQHPEILTNTRLATRAQAYALEAEDAGYRADSPEYFQYVTDRLWPRQAQQRPPTAEVIDLGEAQDQRRQAAIGATAARPARTGAATGAAGVKKPTRVTLSAEERDMALRLYQGDKNMTDDDRIKRYAANKAAMIADGSYQA